jgi:diguanylate cyclase (GGDEF)-like protein/PAS domain S-box-containing protein
LSAARPTVPLVDGPAAGRARLHRDGLLLGLFAATIAAVCWLAFGRVGTAAGVLGNWSVQLALDVTYFVLCRRVVGLPDQSRPVRRFWHAMSVAGVLFILADLVQLSTTIPHPTAAAATPGAASTGLVMCGVACMVWVMLTHPTGMTGQARLRMWLDATTVLTAAAVFSWYFSVGGGTARSGLDVASALLTSAVMLVSVFGAVKLLLGGEAPFTFGAGVSGAAAAGLISASGALGETGETGGHLNQLLAVRLLPMLLLAATPRVQELQIRARPGALTARPVRRYSRLPYLAAGATQGLLVAMIAALHPETRLWGVVLGALAITVLVVVRQLAAFADNAGLLRRLDASMTELRQHEQRFRSLVQHASDVTVLAHADTTVAYASPALERVLGIPPGQLLGRRCLDLLATDDLVVLWPLLTGLLADPYGSITFQTRVRHADRSWRLLDVTCTNLLDDPSVAGVICNARDVTEARQLQDRLRYQASHDPLTQLANRALFDERLRAALQPAVEPDGGAAVLVIDLDDFKIVNDTRGHHAGDALLVAVAARLRACARPADTVSRLGGDEFGVLLPGVSGPNAVLVADRIRAAFIDPVSVDGYQLTIRASVGLAVADAGESADAMLRSADAAMYAAKRRNRARGSRRADSSTVDSDAELAG